jgi:preflagellin peptidase FlaK
LPRVFDLQALDATRIATALLFLFYASWSDYKSREVRDATWILFAPIGFTLTFVEVYFFEPSQLTLYGISFALTAAFSLIIFYSGGFGGADAKALMCLALVVPFYPANLLNPLFSGASPISQIVFPFTVFSNAVLLSAFSAVIMVVYNMLWRLRFGRELFTSAYENRSLGRKILILITGYKVSIDQLKQKWHVYPLEDVEEKSQNTFIRKLLVLPKDEGRDATVERLEKAVKAGIIQNGIWATPGLPFLIFVTIGLALALFLGDIIWIFVRLVMI